jgi:mono/diheme cytochrome c family protein
MMFGRRARSDRTSDEGSRIVKRPWLIGGAAIVVIALLSMVGFGWRWAITPIARPAAAVFAPAQIARGQVLAAAGYCATCHTARGGAVLAGGYAMATPFGTIYSTNITPDPETGIGNWSLAAFRRAMNEGVARDGSHLFPAFPYDHFTKLTDGDVADLYAFLMTRPAVKAPPKSNTIPFPLNLRLLQAGWKLLYFKPGRFTPDASKDAIWNRGAYLVEGISHCGACHTSRGALGAENKDKAYAGALIDHWIAPPLTAANPSPVPWSADELVAYLGTGVSRYHGVAAGPMGPVSHGLSKLPPADLKAIAVYLTSFNGAAGKSVAGGPAIRQALAADRNGIGLQYDAAARLYTAACASCHYNSGKAPNPLRPELALNSAVNMDDPRNLIRVILYGISAADGIPGVVMPGFARAFSNADVGRIADYLRATRTSRPAWPDLEKKVAAIRAEGRGQEQ